MLFLKSTNETTGNCWAIHLLHHIFNSLWPPPGQGPLWSSLHRQTLTGWATFWPHSSANSQWQRGRWYTRSLGPGEDVGGLPLVPLSRGTACYAQAGCVVEGEIDHLIRKMPMHREVDLWHNLRLERLGTQCACMYLWRHDCVSWSY